MGSLEKAMQGPAFAGPADDQAAVEAQALGLPELAGVGNRWGWQPQPLLGFSANQFSFSRHRAGPIQGP